MDVREKRMERFRAKTRINGFYYGLARAITLGEMSRHGLARVDPAGAKRGEERLA
jgi:hypothetical protein